MPPQPGQQHDSRARGRQGDPLHVARRLDALAAGLAGVALSAMEQRLDAVNPVVPLTLIWRSATVPARCLASALARHEHRSHPGID